MSGKGFSAVGLNEILAAAGVPKGSFYHYFSSKEAFGKALLERYFDNYLSSMDEIFARTGMNAAVRLQCYWQHWLSTQTASDHQGKCLVVKLAAEVADLSEGMREVLEHGTSRIIRRLSVAIGQGLADDSIKTRRDPDALAQTLYQSWLGASLLAKITQEDSPLRMAMLETEQTLFTNPKV